MPSDIVFTLTGPDRVGIVEDVTRAFLEIDGNVGTSRMTRLGGAFSMLMLVTLPDNALTRLDNVFAELVAQGFRTTVTATTQEAATGCEGWLPYRVSVEGADHEGIVHEIAQGLSASGITIESMETGTTSAPVSGTPLFKMDASVLVPPNIAEVEWTSTLLEASRRAGVDIEVTHSTPD